MLHLGILVGVFVILMLFTQFNYGLYNQTIGTVVEVTKEKYQEKEIYQYDSGNEENQLTITPKKEAKKEIYWKQTLNVKIRNGQRKGEVIKIDNIYSYTGLNNEEYKKGNDLFLKLSEDPSATHIKGIKRDQYVVLIAYILIVLLVYEAGLQGILTIVTVIMNVAVFVTGIVLYKHGYSFQHLTIGMLIIFSIGTLVILNGFQKKTLGAVISSLLTLGSIFLMYKIVELSGEEPPYDLMDYIVGPSDLSAIFVSSIMIGCLGAIMDVAITLNSAIFELVEVAKDTSIRALIKAARGIGYDIMGTMINVLLFTYICGEIPLLIVKIRNGYSFTNIVRFNIIFELYRFTIGSIAIVLAIPISAFVAIVLVSRRKGKVK